jgi:hypothetical protein
MTDLPPLTRDQRKVDQKHLEILSIFHFVGAGLALIGILFLFAHYEIMHTVFTNPDLWKNQKQQPPFSPEQFFNIFRWFYLIFGSWFLLSGILNVISAFCLRAKKHRTFSLVVAGINCLHIPLGTVLGVFTIIVLVRESVRELYSHART